MTSEHTFLEKYISHTSKWLQKGCERVMCGRWVGDWTNCNILTPSSFVFGSTSFSFCCAAQSGILRVHSPLLGAGSLYSTLSPTNWLQLTELLVAPGYIIVWHPPASCERRICTQFNPSTVKVMPWYLRSDAPIPWLTSGSTVNMLHRDVLANLLNCDTEVNEFELSWRNYRIRKQNNECSINDCIIKKD